MTTQDNSSVYIPDESEIQTPTGRRETWRFSEGKIVTGREADKNLREREKVVGQLKRIGIHFGVSKTKSVPFGQIEADWETSNGMIRLKASLTNTAGELAPSTSALTYAEGLLDLALGEIAICTANKATKPNSHGAFPTYANLFHYNVATRGTKPCERRPFVKGRTAEAYWHDLEAEIRTHPAYSDRPATDSDEEEGALTHFVEFCKECAAKGWPTPEQAPAEWLDMMAKPFGLEKPHAQLNDHNDDQWGAIRQGLQDVTEMPAKLIPVAQRLNAAKAAPVNLAGFGG